MRQLALGLLIVTLALVDAAPPAAAQILPPAREPLSAPGQSGEIWGDERRELVDRLFRAVVDRSPLASEAEQAAVEVGAGRLAGVIDTLVTSSEYRDLRARTSARRLLEQYFRALVDRSPNPQEISVLSRELGYGRDGLVVRRVVDSEEFTAILRGASPPPSAAPASGEGGPCLEAVERKMSEDLGRTVELRLVSWEITASSVLTEELTGEAETTDSARTRVGFTCRIDRFGGGVSEASYEVRPGAAPEREVLVRCESDDLRIQRCPADTTGGVELVRQEGRAPCIEGRTWGYDERGIWVHLGCRGVFRVAVMAALAGLESAVDGWGFVHQSDGRAEWLSRAAVELEPDGAVRLELSGDGTARFAGRWYEAGESRVGITLDGPSGPERPIGAGELRLRDREIEHLELAGESGALTFDIVFTRRLDSAPMRFDAAGTGVAELDGGRRIRLDRATIDLLNDGRANLHFSGESEDTLTGRWFVGWGNPIQLAIDGPSADGTTGFGSIHRGADGSFKVEISGVTGPGTSFRIEFLSEGG